MNEGKYSVSPFFGVPVGNGVCHGDDLIYLWVVKAVGTSDVSSLTGKTNILWYYYNNDFETYL